MQFVRNAGFQSKPILFFPKSPAFFQNQKEECNLPSAICHLSSAICHLPSAIKNWNLNPSKIKHKIKLEIRSLKSSIQQKLHVSRLHKIPTIWTALAECPLAWMWWAPISCTGQYKSIKNKQTYPYWSSLENSNNILAKINWQSELWSNKLIIASPPKNIIWFKSILASQACDLVGQITFSEQAISLLNK